MERKQANGDMRLKRPVRRSHGTWVINRPALFEPPWDQFWMILRSREAFTSPSDPASERFCEHLRQIPRDFTLYPFWLWRFSSGNRWQGTREHLARRPSPSGSSRCHRRSTLSIALRHQLASALSWMHERYSQCLVRTDKMIVRTPPLQ